MTKTAKLTVFIILFDFRLILSSKCVLFVLVLNVYIDFADEPDLRESTGAGADLSEFGPDV